MAASSLAFVARRGEPELVAPAGPTPRELKRLSDLDDQESLRFYRSVIYFYRGHPSRSGLDPARVIRHGLAAALLHYYPIAGRLRELPGRKLAVDCTGEGVWFVVADADVALDEFGDTLCPPVPCAGELLCLPESNSAVVVNRPLLYVQVTRLRCGGFVFGIQVCHSLVDAPGITQFLQAVGELAGGMEAPSVRPVWARELLDARDPPRPNYQHPEYELVANAATDKLRPGDKLVHRAFLFGPEEIASLREQLPPRMRARCSRFLLLSAFAWRCRTVALGYEPGDEVRFMFVMNARGKRDRPLRRGSTGTRSPSAWRGQRRRALLGAAGLHRGTDRGCEGADRRRRLRAVGGRRTGAARAAAVHDGADVPGDRPDQVEPSRGGPRVGDAGVRRAGHDDAGHVPHSRDGRRYHRAHVLTTMGHGEVRGQCVRGALAGFFAPWTFQ
ncbi:hypothetical protein ACQ4PT_053971 [Festuca glaucescens]